MSFDAVLRKYFPGVVLGLLALCAYLQARGLSNLIGTNLGSSASTSLVTSVSAPAPGDAAPKSAEPILVRNAFDSATGPLNAKPDQQQADEDNKVVDPLRAPACKGVTTLIVSESPDPKWSMATLKVEGTDVIKPLRVGDAAGDKAVGYIGYNPLRRRPSVWLIDNGALCQSLLDPPAEAANQQKAPAPKKAAPIKHFQVPPPLPKKVSDKIEKIGDTEYRIDRAAMNDIIQHKLEYLRVRITPVTENGKEVGLQLRGVRNGSLLRTLGLLNGDRLEAVNGKKLTNAPAALQAFSQLQGKDNLTIQVSRKGKPITFQYRIE